MFKKSLLVAAVALAGMTAVSIGANAAAIIVGTPGSGAANGADNCNSTCIAAAFTAANITTGTWTLVGQPEVFGTGGSGNGFFNPGGTATLRLELASDSNAFGVVDDDTHSPLVPVLTTAGNNVGDTAAFTNPDTQQITDFSFYFRDLTTSRTCFSDESDCSNGLDMAIYQNGNTFAFFFDDGGNNNDNDYNDMVVTVTLTGTPGGQCTGSCPVPAPGLLGLLGAGVFGLGFSAARRRRAAS